MAEMAEAKPLETANEFEERITRIRNEMRTHFEELYRIVKWRETELLTELDAILKTYKEKAQEQEKMMAELDKTREFLRQNIQNTGLVTLQQELMGKIRASLRDIHIETEKWNISFTFDNSLLSKLKSYGQLKTPISSDINAKKLKRSIDYKSKLEPIISFGSEGNGIGQFNEACGVAVDPCTSNIYVTDKQNQRIQVFSQDGHYLFHFGERYNNYPTAISIYNGRAFVVQLNGNCLSVFLLDGTHIKTVGTYGSRDGEMNYPNSLGINPLNGDIYICDTDNNRIQLFSDSFQFKASLWGKSLYGPLDIQLTKTSILVLDRRNPCIHWFNYSNMLVKSFVGNDRINYSLFFCTDAENNIIIGDYSTGIISVFTIEGILVHQFGKLKDPYGIAITDEGRIIISSQTKDKCVQIW